MRAVIYLKQFTLGLALLSLAGATILGKVQEIVSFSSVASEIAMVLFSFTFGTLALISSVKIKK